MLTVLALLGAFFWGMVANAAYVNKQVRTGRLEAGGRIYLCKDTGPKVRP